MSDYRTQVNIPVTRDARTFEQCRKDMFNNLERRTSTRLNDRVGAPSDTSATSLTTDSGIAGNTFRSPDDWDREVDRWIGESRRRWNEEMRRMRQDMFALEPVDDFTMDRWGPMDTLGSFDHPTSHSSMIARMEREMETLRQQMGDMTSLGPTRFPGTGGRTIQSSSTSRVTTSTTSGTGDPRSMQTRSNVQESVQHSRTVNGVTTGTSSHSSMSSKSTGPEALRLTQGGTPGALLPQGSVPGGVMNFLKDAYELDEDGQVHFKVRFDAKDFAPEDIDVTTVDNRLTVHAKKVSKTGGNETAKEFSRTVDLPQSIDHEHFQCNLTEDGVLILDAPVKAPDYQSITFDKDSHLSIRPKSEAELRATSSSTCNPLLVPLGVSGPTILNDGPSGRKLHLEVPIDPEYKAENLCVRMDANRIIVSGKQQSTSGGRATQEFSRSYEVPETVDPFSVTAQLSGTTLIIEAPLLCSM
ncbi:hypothetical protein CRM22_009547 [Opisthorchis felineus]|uniref:SHSP domain-containing protein n=1 Tax=Opisthorchis felineus TaxID=147828 RepID=A0A4S2L6D1_OPIFE|nr:hypothetical protein CRM22_009547 [Opisthorchis felineus]